LLYRGKMSSRKFAGIFIAIFVLGAFPLLLVQPSGAASAGLSAGFSAPVQHILFMLVFVAIGVWATVLGGYATVGLPLGVTLMLLTGGMLAMNNDIIIDMKLLVLAAIMLFAVIASMIRSRLYLLSITVLGSVAFQLGNYYVATMPPLATPQYYVLGVMVSNMLIMGIGICIGITVVDDMQKWIDALRAKTVQGSFLSFFL
jgi:hydrogenase/urease accessory protein HupE